MHQTWLLVAESSWQSGGEAKNANRAVQGPLHHIKLPIQFMNADIFETAKALERKAEKGWSKVHIHVGCSGETMFMYVNVHEYMKILRQICACLWRVYPRDLSLVSAPRNGFKI